MIVRDLAWWDIPSVWLTKRWERNSFVKQCVCLFLGLAFQSGSSGAIKEFRAWMPWKDNPLPISLIEVGAKFYFCIYVSEKYSEPWENVWTPSNPSWQHPPSQLCALPLGGVMCSPLSHSLKQSGCASFYYINQSPLFYSLFCHLNPWPHFF